MLQVKEIYDEGKKIAGNCDDVRFYRWVGDALQLIANKLELEGYKGWVDICADNDRCVTLPREVQTVLSVNIGGHPTLGFDQLFNFHLNGPGDCNQVMRWSWQDQGRWHSTYRDIVTPSKLVVYLETDDDNNKSFLVHGFDEDGHPLWHEVGGVRKKGLLIPTVYGYAIPDADAPKVSRITGIEKEDMVGMCRLSTTDDGGNTGVLLGVYEPDEVLPQYRRIKLGRCSSWVRIAYRKDHPRITSLYDRLPLLSRLAFLLALRACKAYNEQDFAIAHAFEADAARLELEAQQQIEPPTHFPPQAIDYNNIRDKSDYENIG